MFAFLTGIIDKFIGQKKSSTNTTNTLPVIKITKPTQIKTYDKSKCMDLSSTAELFANIIINDLDMYDVELVQNTTVDNIYPIFPHDIFNILLEFVFPQMVPTTEQIDSMLLVARVLLASSYNEAYEEFIFNCPEKFLLTYGNNSEQTPNVLSILKSRQMVNSYNKIIGYVTPERLNTWYERNSNK